MVDTDRDERDRIIKLEGRVEHMYEWKKGHEDFHQRAETERSRRNWQMWIILITAALAAAGSVISAAIASLK